MNNEIKLPKPSYIGKVTVEEALYTRHSVREYANVPLTLNEVSQLCWAANGVNEIDAITGASRTAPSAGGIYPFDVYLVVYNVEGLTKGLYKYIPEHNQLNLVLSADLQTKFYEAVYSQSMFLSAGMVMVYAIDLNRVKSQYGDRGINRYTPMDIGHSAENVYLQGEVLGIGTVAVGAFDDKKVEQVLNLRGKQVYYLLPLGKKR